MTSLKETIANIVIQIKRLFNKESADNSNSEKSLPELNESINRLQKANLYNCDLAQLLNNYEANNKDFRITLKRGSEIKSLKDIEEIREKYDLSSVE